MRICAIFLGCLLVLSPYLQAYGQMPEETETTGLYSEMKERVKSGLGSTAEFTGNTVKEGLGKGGDLFRAGHKYSQRGLIYGSEKKEDGLYYVKIVKDYAGDMAASLPTILPVLSQDQWLRYLRQLTASAATEFDRALDSKYLETAKGGGNHRLFDGGHTLGGAWNKISRMCAKTGCSHKEQVNGYFRALGKDAVTPKGLPFVTMAPETYSSLAEKLDKYGISRKWTYDALSYDAAEVLAAGIAVATVVYHLKTGQTKELSEALGTIGVMSLASANPLLALIVISSVAYAIATGADLNAAAAAEGIFKSAVVSGVLVLIPGAFLLQVTAAIAISLLLEKNVTEENASFAKDYMREKSLMLKHWFERKGETHLVAIKEPPLGTEDCILRICP